MTLFTRRDALLLSGLLGLVALWYLDPLLGRATFFASDLEMFNYPVRCYYAAGWQRNLFAWWSPLAMCGYPLFAEGQAGALYPGTWLFGLVRPWYALTLDVVLHLWWGGVGAYLWTRSLGANRAGAMVAALVTTFGGTAIAHIVQLNALNALSWMPFAAWGYERSLAGDRRGSLIAGASLGLEILAGHPNELLLTLLLLVTRGLHAAWTARRATPLALVLWPTLIGLGLGAVQLLATMELVPHSLRARPLDWGDVNNWRLKAEYLPLLFATTARGLPLAEGNTVPHLPWEWQATIGRVPLLLTAVGLVSLPAARPWALLCLVAPILAAGGEPYRLVWALPGFNLLRGPLRLLPLATLAAAAVAALSATHFIQDRGARRVVWPAAGSVLAVVALAGLLARPEPVLSASEPSVWGAAGEWLLPLALFGLGALLLRRPLPARHLAAALVLLTAVDLWLAMGSFQPLARPDYWAERDPLTAEARRSGRRVHASFSLHRELGSPHNLQYGVASTSLLSPLVLSRTQRVLERVEQQCIEDVAAGVSGPGWRLLRWMDVGYGPAGLLRPARGEEANQIEAVAGEPSARAWLTSWSEGPDSWEETSARISTGKPALAPGGSGGGGTIHGIDNPSPNRWAVSYEANGRPLVELAENAYPGWRAWLDSREVSWYRTDYLWRGVPSGEGRHTLVWVYDSTTIRTGMFISLLSLAALAAALGRGRR